jgi:hypothetical protein
LWQVESELAVNSTEVAEDLSKLKAGQANHKLLIAVPTTQKDAARGRRSSSAQQRSITGTAYVAEIPTYAGTAAQDWDTLEMAEVEVRLLSAPGHRKYHTFGNAERYPQRYP